MILLCVYYTPCLFRHHLPFEQICPDGGKLKLLVSCGGLTKTRLCTAGKVLQRDESCFDCVELDSGFRLQRPGMLRKDGPQPVVEFWAWRCYRAWRGDYRRWNSAVFSEWTLKVQVALFILSESILFCWLECVLNVDVDDVWHLWL